MADHPYGGEHKKRRAIAIATMVEGMPCRYCLRPMYKHQSLDLDHIVPVVYGGNGGPSVLVHSYCNRSAGGRIGNRRKRTRRNRYGLRIGPGSISSPRANRSRRKLPSW